MNVCINTRSRGGMAMSIHDEIYLEIQKMGAEELRHALYVEKTMVKFWKELHDEISKEALSLKRMIVTGALHRKAFYEVVNTQLAKANSSGKREVAEIYNIMLTVLEEWSCDDDLLNTLISDIDCADSGTPKSLKKQGVVKWYDDEKGYGLFSLKGSLTGEDVFILSFYLNKTGIETLDEGEICEFEIERTENGLVAKNIVKLS